MDEIYINVKQNKSESLRLLAAMRVQYSRAKILRTLRVFVTVLLPIISVLSLKYFPNLKDELALVAAIWLVINRLCIIEKEKSMVKEAAKIQEMFDVGLFQISWNNFLAGEYIQTERIKKLNIISKEKEENLIDWFPGLNSSDHYYNVLLAQRTSIIWDMDLRKIYSNILKWILIMYIIVLIWIPYLLNLPFQTFIISLIVPSLPLILHLIETTNGHKQRYDALEKILTKVENNISNYSGTDESIKITCRSYQDIIFLNRCNVNMIPDKIYWVKRNLFDKIAKESNEEQSEKLL
ncbi:S-4TM family putative pore-forming effector [Lysinibacillus sphaericus]|uniref:Uncharacterized protein n=1 Tax=Lysinibacillus sphaericus TaxID=1421 RepID=A0A6H0A0B6_LYSSH|nr:S-4TM family putative pore-forming effector [Lysinibacillus sphaericus]QIS31197.1 hypothetical protein [Lysinibacillus sphaericus]QPA61255.1 hypothetical protein INQ55_23250 [Lysinibacillus sphaericus]